MKDRYVRFSGYQALSSATVFHVKHFLGFSAALLALSAVLSLGSALAAPSAPETPTPAPTFTCVLESEMPE
jgi:hypothetical protein